MNCHVIVQLWISGLMPVFMYYLFSRRLLHLKCSVFFLYCFVVVFLFTTKLQTSFTFGKIHFYSFLSFFMTIICCLFNNIFHNKIYILVYCAAVCICHVSTIIHPYEGWAPHTTTHSYTMSCDIPPDFAEHCVFSRVQEGPLPTTIQTSLSPPLEGSEQDSERNATEEEEYHRSNLFYSSLLFFVFCVSILKETEIDLISYIIRVKETVLALDEEQQCH